MKGKRTKKKKTTPHQESPPWDCEAGPLPVEVPEASHQTGDTPPAEQDLADTPSSRASVIDDADSQSSFTTLRQSQNAKHSHWQPWQDRFLAQEVLKLQPFAEGSGKAVDEAWDHLAEVMLDDSWQVGPQSVIERTGSACKAWMQKLIAIHKRNETLSLQKTGTNEEINQFIENMTQIVSLVDAQNDTKRGRSSHLKDKVKMEQEAALELRDAAMKGMVERQTLADITQLEDATQCERNNQRPQHPKHFRSPTPSGSNDIENMRPSGKRRRTHNFIIEKALAEHNRATTERLTAARARDDERQLQLMDGLNRLAEGMNVLGTAVCQQIEHDAELRRVEAENRARENEWMADLYRLFCTSLISHPPAPTALPGPPL